MGIQSEQPGNALLEWRSRAFSSGFTLIELMVTIGIAAIMAAIAIPSFQDFYRNNRLATQSNDFMASLSLAKSEAIRRGVRVTLCKSADPAATTPVCDTTALGNWAQGWVVFADIDKDGVIDANETIRVNLALTAATLTGDATFTNWIYFQPDGAVHGNGEILGVTPGETSGFTLCNAGVSRVITVNSRGRVRVVAGTCS